MPPPLRTAVVIGVEEESCRVWADGALHTVAFAPMMPAPRVERISPGHLVAVAESPDGAAAVVWRWFDAVVLGSGPAVDGAGTIRLWEPAHGVIVAQARDTYGRPDPGSRAWASAGLPGAQWWVADAIGSHVPHVELDAVAALYTEYDLWAQVFDSRGAS